MTAPARRNDLGEQIRWSFVDIAANSFRWLGERSRDAGAIWQLQAEFLARRVPAWQHGHPGGLK